MAEGTANDPIIFTSLYDESFGGETDGYASVFPSNPASPAIVVSEHDGNIRLSLSNDSGFEGVSWASDFDGGQGRSVYVGDPASFTYDMPIPYGSNVEAIISKVNLATEECPWSLYTRNISADFACLIGYTQRIEAPLARYMSAPPAAGDWKSLLFSEGSQGVLSHVIMRYGGEHHCSSGCTDSPMVIVRHANLSVSNSSFGDSPSAAISVEEGGQVSVESAAISNVAEGFHITGGRTTIHNSSFENAENGVYIVSAYTGTVDATGNWWGDPIGPKRDFNEIGSRGAWVFPGTIFSPWLSSKSDIGAYSTSTSTASSTGSGTPPAPEGAGAPNPVIIVPGILGSVEHNGRWIIDPIFHVYDSLIDTFLANGYIASSTLFTFPYDWRRSNAETALLLKKKIGEIKTQCACSKVDIIAHSMGGLVARAYAQSVGYQNDIGSLIFLGTPHRGAPESYLAAEAGEFGSSPWDRVLKMLIDLYAVGQGRADGFDYIKNHPIASVNELLPIYDYLKAASTSSMTRYPDGYPTNPFLENLNQSLSALLGSSIRITNIFGDVGTGTVSAFDIGPGESSGRWIHGKPTSTEYGRGDGTVPLSSAMLGGTAGSRDIPVAAGHIELPSAVESIALKSLTGKEASTTARRFQPEHILMAIMHSPAHMAVIAPTGERTGRDFATGGETQGIPGSFYSGNESEIEYVTVPDPAFGEYRIETEGRGDGAYAVEIQDISDATSTKSIFEGTTSTGLRENLFFDVGSSGTSPIKPVIPAHTDIPEIPPQKGDKTEKAEEPVRLPDTTMRPSGSRSAAHMPPAPLARTYIEDVATALPKPEILTASPESVSKYADVASAHQGFTGILKWFKDLFVLLMLELKNRFLH
ncbi:hypothetical protein KW799_00105 [Candidatus Parcubacteria bacterium]|nr:hypothetical protein [Candidatus Parcubacteria bacterium]